MERHFERELEELEGDLVAMGNLVDDQLDQAFHAMFSGDVEEAALVIARDRKVDALDNRIDDECRRILALTQPVAIDLRLLMAAVQINMQLERIGDIWPERPGQFGGAVRARDGAGPASVPIALRSCTLRAEFLHLSRLLSAPGENGCNDISFRILKH